MDQPPSPQPFEQHRAPLSGWKPLSGMAVTAFVLSLVLILAAMGGLWITQVVPLVLGIWVLVKVKPGERRGRGLALWAVLISILVGGYFAASHTMARGIWKGAAESVLTVFASSSTQEEKVRSLRNWSWDEALEKDDELPQRWLERFEEVTARYGAWKERIEMPSALFGFLVLLRAPDGVVEVGSEDAKPPWKGVASVVWFEAPFEKGPVYMALVIHGGDQEGMNALAELAPGEESPLLGDVRFYAPRGP